MKRRSRKSRKQQKNFTPSLKALLAGFLGMGAIAHADAPVGIIGGENSGSYAALLTDLTGTVVPVTGLPTSGVSFIDSVAISSSGMSLIGGRNDSALYAAYVAADGTVNPLTLSIPTGQISSVAINGSDLGLIGGRDFGGNNLYVAHVLPSGTVTPVSVSADSIEAVALNNAGVGLIGGEGLGLAYAAYVASDGTVTQVGGIPFVASHFYDVAINENGNGIAGGSFLSTAAYAALVYPPGGPDALTLTPLPSGSSAIINGVAINLSGNGLIGGVDGSSNAYAGLVDTSGNVTALFDSPFAGAINSVDLNDSGIGLVGGQNGSDLYAALVQSNGSLTPLFLSSVNGGISSVALDNSGVGLIGGQTNGSTGYAALVAPNGTLTPLTISASTIHSVDVQKGSSAIFGQVVPTSVGPYAGSPIYTLLAGIAALETRLIQQNQVWNGGIESEGTISSSGFNSDRLQANLAFSPQVEATPKTSSRLFEKDSLWLQPFGNLIYLEADGKVPKFSNEIGGALLGYDRQDSDYLVGISAGYAFNYVSYAESLGHAKVQEETLALYGAYYGENFWFALAFWGGLYQSTNIRHPIPEITSKGKTHGWIFEPHLEFASPWALDQKKLCYVEPFVRFDWVNSWQRSYTETGSSGLNLLIPSLYNSLLQSELGVRFYERFVFGWGDFRLEEKLSYINQAPFGNHVAAAGFVSSVSSFPVALASTRVQNLGSVEILGCFVPSDSAYPYGGFSFEAMVGNFYQSYFASVFLGKNF